MLIQSGEHFITAVPGETILAAVRGAQRHIDSICGGRGMCGTCRVTVAEAFYNLLAPPAPHETRLLRVLKNPLPFHRLACQTVLDENHDGLRFTPDPPPSKILNKEFST